LSAAPGSQLPFGPPPPSPYQQNPPIAWPIHRRRQRRRERIALASPTTTETTVTTEIKSTQTDRIRTLNDELRKNFSHGHAVMTIGIAALGAEAVARIVKTVEVYDDFCHANDPYEEHDFGSFEIEGHTVFSRSIITIPL
jgi:hypothetical protein